MKVKHVLIVFKKTTFQLQVEEYQEPRFLKLIDEGHQVVKRVRLAHEEHNRCLKKVQSVLNDAGISYDALPRISLNEHVANVDMVISVGGDGTFLDASHHLNGVRLLGVNSSRSSSFGHFCLANEDNFAQILSDIQNDKLAPHDLMRLQVKRNGRVLPEPVLNEVLICHENPAGTSRYFINLAGITEEQRSSGVWIGPPSGSTGVLKAAGGKVQGICDRQFQFIVREPGERPAESWKLIKGLVNEGQEIKLTSQMRTGVIYIDGSHISYPFALGDEIVIAASPNNLIAYVDPDVNSTFIK